MLKLLVIGLLAFLILNDDFNAFKARMEEKVKGLASEMEIIYGRRCSNDTTTCQNKSFDECEGTSTKKCFEDFPFPDLNKENCSSTAPYLSEKSAVRFPSNINTSHLTEEERIIICASAQLEDKFQQLDVGRNKSYGKAYVGTHLGIFRSYPTIRNKTCQNYDPRFRPWYAAASSGAKNVLIFIDTSEKMYRDPINLAKLVAETAIDTLSNNDFFGVVSFNENAQSVHSEGMVRGTQENQREIIKAIWNLKT